MGTGVTGIWGFIWESLTALIPLQQRQSNLCMFLQHGKGKFVNFVLTLSQTCLLYTSDAADE